MTEDYIQNVIERLLDETMSWATKGRRARSVFEAIGAVIQLWEDMRFDLELSTRLPEATGKFLDQWGELVDEKRGNLSSDDEYRRILEAKIQANRSNAFPQELIRIARTLYRPVELTYYTHYTAHVRIVVVPDEDLSDTFIRRAKDILTEARPAGVGLEVVETPQKNILRLQDTEQTLDGPLLSRRIV